MADKSEETMALHHVYLPARMDTELRDLAHRSNKSKNDLILASLANRLLAWVSDNGASQIEDDVQMVMQFA